MYAKTYHRLLTVRQICRSKLALGLAEYIVDVARGVVVDEQGTSFIHIRSNVADLREKSSGKRLQRRSRGGRTLHRRPLPVSVHVPQPEVRVDYVVVNVMPAWWSVFFVCFVIVKSPCR